eukprot:7842639-Alexandrium_andersonii.AAC.1
MNDSSASRCEQVRAVSMNILFRSPPGGGLPHPHPRTPFPKRSVSGACRRRQAVGCPETGAGNCSKLIQADCGGVM